MFVSYTDKRASDAAFIKLVARATTPATRVRVAICFPRKPTGLDPQARSRYFFNLLWRVFKLIPSISAALVLWDERRALAPLVAGSLGGALYGISEAYARKLWLVEEEFDHTVILVVITGA